jgi:hypothetical protein
MVDRINAFSGYTRQIDRKKRVRLARPDLQAVCLECVNACKHAAGQVYEELVALTGIEPVFKP